MTRYDVKALVALVAVIAAFGVSGCSDGGGDSGAVSTSADCLTAEQVQQEVDNIAQGVEVSQEEVEQKQEAIREMRARECE